jgi:glucose-6-phosphate isomerase
MEPASLHTDWTTGHLAGADVVTSVRTIGDLVDVFADESARAAMDPNQVVYRTECVFPLPEGTAGGLFWGTTFIEPGAVGQEFFMTKGHYHRLRDRAEVYFTFAGEGALICKDATRSWVERMTVGSTHIIAPGVAHRTANVGSTLLSFGACWPADAGHDYEAIAREGFGVRVVRGAAGARVVSG